MMRWQVLKKQPNPQHWWNLLPEAGQKPAAVIDWERKAAEAIAEMIAAAEKIDHLKQLEYQAIAAARRNWTESEINNAISAAYCALPEEFREAIPF
jgi:hypothetical protein